MGTRSSNRSASLQCCERWKSTAHGCSFFFLGSSWPDTRSALRSLLASYRSSVYLPKWTTSPTPRGPSCLSKGTSNQWPSLSIGNRGSTVELVIMFPSLKASGLVKGEKTPKFLPLSTAKSQGLGSFSQECKIARTQTLGQEVRCSQTLPKFVRNYLR